MAGVRYPRVEPFWPQPRWNEWLRRLTQLANGNLEGQSNATLEVTLRPNETTTVVEDVRVDARMTAFWSAKSESAAGAPIYTVTSAGRITIHHDAVAATDRTIGLVFLG